jgi:hypothetical protein
MPPLTLWTCLTDGARPSLLLRLSGIVRDMYEHNPSRNGHICNFFREYRSVSYCGGATTFPHVLRIGGDNIPIKERCLLSSRTELERCELSSLSTIGRPSPHFRVLIVAVIDRACRTGRVPGLDRIRRRHLHWCAQRRCSEIVRIDRTDHGGSLDAHRHLRFGGRKFAKY